MTGDAAGATRKVDRKVLLTRLDGDEELLAELVTLFLESYGELTAELHEGIRNQAPMQLRTAAHALKGSIANFSEGPAFTLARELEHLGQTNDLSQAEAKFAALEQELAFLCLELQECLQPSSVGHSG